MLAVFLLQIFYITINVILLILPELKKTIYRIYSSERPGRSFNFELPKGGAYSKEALIEYIKKTSKYFQLVS